MVRIATFNYSDHEGPDDFKARNKMEQLLREETRSGEWESLGGKVSHPGAKQLAGEFEGKFANHVLPKVSVIEFESSVEVEMMYFMEIADASKDPIPRLGKFVQEVVRNVEEE